MKMDLRFLPANTYARINGTTANALGPDLAQNASGDAAFSDQMFSDLLDTELSKYQRVISAEEVLADLDGSPTFSDDSLPSAMGSGFGQSAPAGKSAIMDAVKRIAARFHVDDNLVSEVIRAESNFNPNAISGAGAKGLMQLMDATARSMNVNDSFNPVQNITGGTKYLGGLLQKYHGNVKVALAAYNAGPGRIDRLGIATDRDFDAKADELPLETQKYVAKITGRLNETR
ncbi:lytic transglycosylase domain-containing protein [Brevibacillus fluminis]|uniref:lytic transglycosylase domain-containing protein n=1 Tax=Brevibacillus fluminis TaxID=511487 RepID=UPI003F8A126C